MGYKSFTKHGGRSDHRIYQMHYLDLSYKAYQRAKRYNKYAVKKVKDALKKKNDRRPVKEETPENLSGAPGNDSQQFSSKLEAEKLNEDRAREILQKTEERVSKREMRAKLKEEKTKKIREARELRVLKREEKAQKIREARELREFKREEKVQKIQEARELRAEKRKRREAFKKVKVFLRFGETP